MKKCPKQVQFDYTIAAVVRTDMSSSVPVRGV